MTRKTVQKDPAPAQPATDERLGELLAKLNTARSTIYLTAEVLGRGDERTDLEQHSSIALKEAYEALDCACDELFSLRIAVRDAEASYERRLREAPLEVRQH